MRDFLEDFTVDIIGREISFLELDNYMVNAGFCSEYNVDVEEHIKSTGIIFYYIDCDSSTISISLDLTFSESFLIVQSFEIS